MGNKLDFIHVYLVVRWTLIFQHLRNIIKTQPFPNSSQDFVRIITTNLDLADLLQWYLMNDGFVPYESVYLVHECLSMSEKNSTEELPGIVYL